MVSSWLGRGEDSAVAGSPEVAGNFNMLVRGVGLIWFSSKDITHSFSVCCVLGWKQVNES